MDVALRPDPVAGRAFFRRTTRFVCALLGPHAERESWLGFAVRPGPTAEAHADALALARAAGGRGYAIVAERVALGNDDWPVAEPPFVASYVVERGGLVVFAPSIEIGVHMPPREPHLMLRLVHVERGDGGDGESRTRAALAALGTCGMVARVSAVVHGDSGAEVDAIVRGPGDRLEAGWFARKP